MRKRVIGFEAGFAIFTALLLCAWPASAQQLEPRAYSPSPIGANFLGLGYLYSTGSVVIDPSLPIQNVHARIHTVVPYYGRTFGLLGQQASVTLVTPYALGTVTGEVQDESRRVDLSGLVDPQVRFAVNLLGGPALTPEEFFKHAPETALGTSLTMIAPFGQYNPARLVNLGTNRWAFKPELGLSQPLGNWGFEFYAGVWFFTANDDYVGGEVRRQDPLASFQTHVVYSVRPRLWAAFDFTYYVGGGSTVNGTNQNNRQDNTRGGLTLSVPVTSSQSLKVNWARGVSTRVGSEFESIGIAWQLLWF